MNNCIVMEELPQKITIRHLKKMLGDKEFDFKCTACGSCCKGAGIIYFLPHELNRIVEFLNLAEDKAYSLKKRIISSRSNGYYLYDSEEDCLFLGSDGLCSIYEVRPVQCRSYPFWPSLFQSRKTFQALKKESNGVMTGKGEKFTLLQMLRRINRNQIEFSLHQEDIYDLIIL